MEDDMKKFKLWSKEKLDEILGFTVGDEFVNYMLSFENQCDLEEHLSSLLDIEEDSSKQFITQFMKKWSSLQKSTSSSNNNKSLEKSQNHRNTKSEFCANYSQNEMASPPNVMRFDSTGSTFLDKNRIMENEVATGKSPSPFKKKQLKYVPLYKSDGKLKTDTIMLPGRHPCRCLAQKHQLINNCMQCGRIVCEQEGSGPCLFCGNLVCTAEDMDAISRNSKKSKKLKEKLLMQVPTSKDDTEKEVKGLEKALQHKNKLLEYDKNCAKRTQVIDDEEDYYSYDSQWLSTKQKAALKKKENEIREKRFASRLEKKYTLDFAGRRVVGDDESTNTYSENNDDAEYSENNFMDASERSPLRNVENSLIDPRITITPPKFSCTQGFDENVTNLLKNQQQAVKNSLRLQDKGLQEITDQGMCLSMHQPWASLLVYGIKKLEGRSWYSSHRGRLWIASTAKKPEKELIENIENQYKHIYSDGGLNFPKEYPTGAILGCVNVADCVENEAYFKTHRNDPEESDSPYLFVCDNSQQLKIAFSMKGKHKIYKLDSHVHNAARKSLIDQ